LEGNSFLCSLEKTLVGGLFLEAFVALVEGFARGKRTKVVRRRKKRPRLFCGKRSAVKGVGGGRGGGRIGFERFGDGGGEEEIIGKKNGSGIH
jgi:hypothetical protein